MADLPLSLGKELTLVRAAKSAYLVQKGQNFWNIKLDVLEVECFILIFLKSQLSQGSTHLLQEIIDPQVHL
jgi:hypothetical protein